MHKLHGLTPLSQLGKGGAGEVWRAKWRGAIVALKVLHGRQDTGALRREARLVAALDHPNIIDVYDLARSAMVLLSTAQPW